MIVQSPARNLVQMAVLEIKNVKLNAYRSKNGLFIFCIVTRELGVASWKAALSHCDEILRLSCGIFTKIDHKQLNKPGCGQPVTQSGDKGDLAHASARE